MNCVSRRLSQAIKRTYRNDFFINPSWRLAVLRIRLLLVRSRESSSSENMFSQRKGTMGLNWSYGLATFCLLVVYANGQLPFSENSPPILTLDRSWDIPITEPVGTVITRVRASDQENDPLTFGLELNDPNRRNPFIIDEVTGVVKLKESLEKRGGEKFLIYVTVTDGHYTMKNEVFVNIKNSTSAKGLPSNKSSRPPYYPTYLLPNAPIVHSEVIPPPKIVPTVGHVPQRKTDKILITTPKQDEEVVATTTTTTSSSPPQISTKVNVTANTTNITPSEIAYTIIPTAVICGVLFTAVLIVFLFRRRICKYRNKMQKEDMRKESHGGIILEDPIAMHHWRGPRAFSNRYEGWDSDRTPQPPPIQNDREGIKTGDKWEFPRHHLKVFNILGEGCFGQVWRCEALNIDGKEGTTVVAVKTLKENAGDKERKDLLQELEVMKMLEPHPNVVRLLGCCTEKDPLFVIMEFVAMGKLQSYLRNSRAERYYGNMHAESKTLTSRDLTGFAYQCARGMEFLSSKGIIHRDLAARNILVSNDQVCKVADFGFARDIIGSHVYERKSEGRLPIRWMAPESLYDNIFSVKSDVWGFGVLVWEIVTLGSTPYPGLAAADVMRKVRDGYRLEKPDHCRRELYNIMYYCWDKDPKDRPSFEELVTLLEQLLLSETDYIELDRFPDHSYYNMISLSGEKL